MAILEEHFLNKFSFLIAKINIFNCIENDFALAFDDHQFGYLKWIFLAIESNYFFKNTV